MFQVLVRGDGVIVAVDGVSKTLSFYTTRIVQATDRAAAANNALLSVAREVRDRVMNDVASLPQLVVEEVKQTTAQVPTKTPGFSFFEDAK
ncbi:MAG: hypothetical protein AAFQ77_03035 [Myxococcota bacterium]